METTDETEAADRPTAPAISVPKGGGAISGIGEKFAANSATGTGSLSVPLAVSTGRSGFGPAPSLAYDTGTGNGPFGLGWTLSSPAIRRKTEKGVPQYDDARESDVFVLSGAEDLVPVFDTEGNRHADRTTSPGHTIHQYRPRVEGAFARIERWTREDTGKTHWRSITGDNVTTLYGTSAESRISDPQDPNHVFEWLTCATYDDKGNAAVYDYLAEDDQGIDLAHANERNRIRTAQRYPKRIRYGNRISRLVEPDLTKTDWMFELVFDYEDGHYDDVPLDCSKPPEAQHRYVRATATPTRSWGTRPDPFSSYRAGFEVRTQRRCRRVLLFHCFDELGPEPCLVRSTDFEYADFEHDEGTSIDDELAHRGSTRFASFLRSVTHSGYVPEYLDGDPRLGSHPGRTYLVRSTPPLDFDYSTAAIREDLRDLDASSLENLPVGINEASYRWVDLDGEGAPGILTEQGGGAWYYKPNLGNGNFGPLQTVKQTPTRVGATSGSQQLLDLAGDGQLDMVEFDGATPGFYERENQAWIPFRPFATLPRLNWDDENLRFVDLTGEGHADLLITEGESLTWYPSAGEKGFEAARQTRAPLDEENGPRLIFADGAQSTYVADMSGDGLPDLVRIRNGEVCYWPSLGHGRFGSKVTMDNAPWFDDPGHFNRRRIRIADIDGSGTNDIVYVGRDGVRLYFNQSGNRWSQPRRLLRFPQVDDLSSITAIDLLGNGTTCLVWSTALPGEAQRPMRYLDLMGGRKPHLLSSVDNNLGATTHIHYAPSTRFYLADKAASRPWATRLPFPVHVVERIETYDHLSRNRFSQRYAYHHGFFDGFEREFGGFGLVEQWDSEEIGTLSDERSAIGAANRDPAYVAPTIYTKTWFHTGVHLGRDRISDFFARGVDPGRRGGEYYREPGATEEEALQLLLPDTVVPEDLTIPEEREACRALRGVMLRQEVYAVDGGPREAFPYNVTEQNFTIQLLQPRYANRHGVYSANHRESIEYHYERGLGDPRVEHSMTLEVDMFGNVLREIAIAHGRRQSDESLPTDADREAQTRELITYTRNGYTNPIDDAARYPNDYRTPLPCEAQTYELTGFPPGSGPAGSRFDEWSSEGFARLDATAEIPYEAEPSREVPQMRLVEHVRTVYRKNDLSGLSTLGELESRALQGESYELAFTPGLLAQIFVREGEALVNDHAELLGGKGGDRGGYRSSQSLRDEGIFTQAPLAWNRSDGDDHWWSPSGRVFLSKDPEAEPQDELEFALEHFHLPHRYRDPFYAPGVSTESSVTYDDYDLLMIETADAMDNRVTVGGRLPDGRRDPGEPGNDYRVLKPIQVMDPNRNRTRVAFDALGMVVGVALMGRTEEELGDSLAGFVADLTESVVLAQVKDPGADRNGVIGRATSRIISDPFAYHRSRRHSLDPEPGVVCTLARETHDAEDQPLGRRRIQQSFAYSDGFGREIQSKVQAEPDQRAEGQTRWVGTGWTVFNMKGNPVRTYEPFFSAGHEFEFAREVGVSPVLFYDALGRVVAKLNPDHSYEKIVFDAWHQRSWDENDTVLGDPRSDLDIAGFTAPYFESLTGDQYASWETWYSQRQADALGPHERLAAQRAAAHAGTPSTVHFDNLGRPFLTLNHNRVVCAGHDLHEREEEFGTRIELDVEGNQRTLRDSLEQEGDVLGRIVSQTAYDMRGNLIRNVSMDAGTKWLLGDVAGKPIRAWDSRGHAIRTEYDRLRRPLRYLVAGIIPPDGGEPGPEILTERLIYGEQHPDCEARNLRGTTHLHLDQAGAVASEQYDFKGNLTRSTRRVALEYKCAIDWSDVEAAIPAGTSRFEAPGLSEALAPFLDEEIYESSTAYDALDRPTTLTTPHTSSMQPSVVRAHYNEANLLDGVDVQLRRAEKSAAPIWTPFVTNIDYDAKGRRQCIEYGNGTTTSHEYDPLTSRLRRLITRRDSGRFPDDCPDPHPRDWPGCQVQNLHYTYDAVGNVTRIQDEAQQTVFFRNARVDASVDYTYDATYRLLQATGREHAEASARSRRADDAAISNGGWSPNDGNAMVRYLERYLYDAVGNLLEMQHRRSDPSQPAWRRIYQYAEPSLIEDGTGDTAPKISNRLSRSGTGKPGVLAEPYTHDAHGNMVRMPDLSGAPAAPESNARWDFSDRLSAVDLGNGGRVYYTYDAAGHRVRRLWEKSSGVVEERRYLGGLEIFRRRRGDDLLERETLHVMDEDRIIALVETRTADTADADKAPHQLVRYQHSNHAGSCSLELDDRAQIISYEDFTPYGSSAYHAVRSRVETPKRYRYTGKERDVETGLSYHGARYYAPWIARWISADPEGAEGGSNLYQYSYGNPANFTDPTGTQGFATFTSHRRGTSTFPQAPSAPLTPEQQRRRQQSENLQQRRRQRSEALAKAAELHGKVEGSLQTIQQEMVELYESYKQGNPTRFWSLEHFFAAVGDTGPIHDRHEQIEGLVDAGVAEPGTDQYWHSTVFERAIENEVVQSKSDQERFIRISEKSRRSAILRWAAWRFVEMALALTPVKGAGAGGMLFARAPQSGSAALQVLNKAARSSGVSGSYKNVVENMSKRAIQFQQKVSGGISAGTSFLRNGVKFDFLDVARKTLVDAKGFGYKNFVNRRTGEYYSWFKGRQGLVDQARRQLAASGGNAVEWVFAERKAMLATQRLFNAEGISGITLKVF